MSSGACTLFLLWHIQVATFGAADITCNASGDEDEASLIQVSGVVYERFQPSEDSARPQVFDHVEHHHDGSAFDLGRSMRTHASSSASSARHELPSAWPPTEPTFLMQLIVNRRNGFLSAIVICIVLGMIPVVVLYIIGSRRRTGLADSVERQPVSQTRAKDRSTREQKLACHTSPTATSVGLPPRTQLGDPGSKQQDAVYLAVPFLLDASTDDMAKKDYQVADESGRPLLRVQLMAPSKELAESASEACEYLTLFSRNDEDELAMCALGSDIKTGAWRCDVYQKCDKLFGHIRQESSQSEVEEFSVVHANKTPALRISVHVGKGGRSRRVEVFTQEGMKCAEAELTDFRFARDCKYYRVECLPDSDLGIVVISIMGVDRLLTHQRSARRSY